MRPFQRIVERIDPTSRLLRVWELKGGASAQVTALELEQADGRIVRWVMRRHSAADLEANPDVAQHEFLLLAQVHAAGLPAPRPIHVDASGTIVPSPYVVLEYIEGAPDLAPACVPDFLDQLARHLARIHATDLRALDVSCLRTSAQLSRWILQDPPAILDEALSEGRIRAALRAVWPLPTRNRSTLLHGDYWPGNVLWKDGRVTGIIDWEDVGVGDPLADVAITRLDTLWLFGVEAMQVFTDRYCALTDIDTTHLPYWDLCAALRPAGRLEEWAGDRVRERAMREGHRFFVTQAFERLSDL